MKSDSVTTAGEALAIDKQAKQEDRTSIAAVMNRPHNSRVRTNLERCTHLDYIVVAIEDMNVNRAPIHIAREIGGYVKFLGDKSLLRWVYFE
jgi:hypothetical protein